jgi:cation diffusion facilitator family transporter
VTTAAPNQQTREQREDRHRDVRRVLWITLGLNLIVALSQISYGYYSNIVSLQADGFHTSFDALSNIIGLVALGIARQPPDAEHPYGHRRIEVAASIVIGIMVLLGLLEVGRAVWAASASGASPDIQPAAYAIVIGTIIINLAVSAYERTEGERLNSMILTSDAAHTLADSLASGAVLVGIYFVDIGIPAGDTLAALTVMLFIGMTAYGVLADGIDVIVDASHLDAERVQEIVEEIDAVKSCHYVRSRGLPGHIHLDLHLTLDPDMPLSEAGDIMLQVKDHLRHRLEDLEDILIQVEPHSPTHVDDVPEQLV